MGCPNCTKEIKRLYEAFNKLWLKITDVEVKAIEDRVNGDENNYLSGVRLIEIPPDEIKTFAGLMLITIKLFNIA